MLDDEKKIAEFADGSWHTAARTFKCVFYSANNKEYIRFRIRYIGGGVYVSEIRRSREGKNTSLFSTTNIQDGCKKVLEWLNANNFTIIK